MIQNTNKIFAFSIKICCFYTEAEISFSPKFSSLAAQEVVKMTTSCAISDENFVKMITFLWSVKIIFYPFIYFSVKSIDWDILVSPPSLCHALPTTPRPKTDLGSTCPEIHNWPPEIEFRLQSYSMGCTCANNYNLTERSTKIWPQ